MVAVTTLLLVAALLTFTYYLIRKYASGGVNKYFPNLKGKVVILTGGTSGIGRHAAKVLHSLNAEVIITGRSEAKAKTLIKSLNQTTNENQTELQFYRVDFADLDQFKKFAEAIPAKYKRLDILINNAGTAMIEYALKKQGVETTMGCNHLAPAYLTSLLMPLLKQTPRSRVVNLSSGAHEIKGIEKFVNKENFWFNNPKRDNKGEYDWMKVYGVSKLANVLFTKGLQKNIQEAKSKDSNIEIKTVSLHPGVINTELSRYAKTDPKIRLFLILTKPIVSPWFKSVSEGAATTLHCALCPYEELVDGEYYADCVVKVSKNRDLVAEKTQFCWEETNRVIKEVTGDDAFSGKQ